MTSEASTEVLTHPILNEEQALLKRVVDHLVARRAAIPALQTYDRELIELRDQVAESRIEDVPALLAEMERVAGISSKRGELTAGLVDYQNPYFAHLALRENDKRGTREREVLIGKSTYINSDDNIRIVDWRHAPVSQIYYRYAEGDEYEETFGDREVEGELLVRRTITIHQGNLLRIATPQGTFVRQKDDTYRLVPPRISNLAGGQGKATRPSQATSRGKLGVGADGHQRVDRHLPEISALLDPRQFELISRTDAGIVVIQGGAGSGKTTIGLHRLAFLNYQGPKKFAGDRMMVVTTSKGLVSYTSEVLPALGVKRVHVSTFANWAARMRRTHFPWIADVPVTDDTPPAVSRLKKHPGVLKAIENRAYAALDDPKQRTDPHAPVGIWAELLTDMEALREAIDNSDAAPLPGADLRYAVRWCSERCPVVADVRPGDRKRRDPRAIRRRNHDGIDETEPLHDSEVGVDGLATNEDHYMLDAEDDALLLRAYQVLRGPLRKGGREPLVIEHLFVDEAQDFSVAELAVLIQVTSARRSITLAGDTSQRLVMDNSFRGWDPLFKDLGIEAIEIEPLKIAYRSTREILELARHVLGPMSEALPTVAPRAGAPVEMFITPGPGVAVAQLGEALRTLSMREPRATIAVLARYADQADMYYEGLVRAEVPNLRRVQDQNFLFRPGVDITEIREVKGLEYDYVIVVDANSSTFPDDVESRHLLHVAATRAAHQLWLLATGPESAVLPRWLVDEAL